MSNVKVTFYIFCFFSSVIFSVVGSSVYILHRDQVTQGSPKEDISLQASPSEEEALKESSIEMASSTSGRSVAVVPKDTSVITNTLSQVSTHNTKANCWLVISNKIYNVSSFLGSHPGGVSVITPFCGKDATTAFKTRGMAGGSNHSTYAYSLLPSYYVGVLNAVTSTTKTSITPTAPPSSIKTPTTSATSTQVAQDLSSTRFTIGSRIKTISNIHVRNTANTSGSLLGTQNLSSIGTVIKDSVYQSSFFWWEVDFDTGVDGWVVEDYISSYIAPQPDPTTPPVVPPPPSGTYTTAQVATHNIQSDCWIIISGKVYNVTSFMNSHPGGISSIRTRCGTDATAVFTTNAGHAHSSYAYSLLPTYYIGDVGTTPPPPPPPGDTTAPSTPTGLSATAVSSSQINLAWTASTDNNAVTGYKIYRGGVQIGTSGSTSYTNTGLSASTAYAYTVSAYDASGNNSTQSVGASATTQAGSAGTSVTYTVNVNSAGIYDVTSLTLNVGDKINFVYTPPRSDEIKTAFSPTGQSTVTVDKDVTQKSKTFSTAGTWTFKAQDRSGNQGTVVVQ